MLRVEINSELVPASLYKEERGAIIFSFELHGDEQVVVMSYDPKGVPHRYDCYTASATAANRPMLYSDTHGRLLTSEEQAVLSQQPTVLGQIV